MTYVVTDACIKCKYLDCVEVCPVDCFYEGENMLVINPSECIDCGVCEPECPAEAILPDTESGLEVWLDGDRWRYADTVGPPILPDTPRVVFRRGFAEFVRCTLDAWHEVHSGSRPTLAAAARPAATPVRR